MFMDAWKRYMNENSKDTELVAVVVLFNDKDQALLLFRNPEDTEQWMPAKWALPGGHLHEDEYPEDGAIREVYEETALVVWGLQKLKKQERATFYVTRKFKGEIVLDTNENTDYAWVGLDELDDYDTVPGLKKTINQALTKLSK
tara:strand:+ start:298 stop:729 length:432 start_codon:yes stop_codon:yes gene_type:complete